MHRETIIFTYPSNLIYLFKLPELFTDVNCIQILSPDPVVPAADSNFGPAERLGNVSREAAKVLSEFMDNRNINLDEYNIYGVDYKFVCVFTENLNHTKEGWTVAILVYSANSDAWTDKMVNILKCTKINTIKLAV